MRSIIGGHMSDSRNFAKKFLSGMKIRLDEEDKKFLAAIDRYGTAGAMQRRIRIIALLALPLSLLLLLLWHFYGYMRMLEFALWQATLYTLLFVSSLVLAAFLCMQIFALLRARKIAKEPRRGAKPKTPTEAVDEEDD